MPNKNLVFDPDEPKIKHRFLICDFDCNVFLRFHDDLFFIDYDHGPHAPKIYVFYPNMKRWTVNGDLDLFTATAPTHRKTTLTIKVRKTAIGTYSVLLTETADDHIATRLQFDTEAKQAKALFELLSKKQKLASKTAHALS
jgi:hypothetical protein